ncbi:PAS domain S-box-containing protein [Rhizobiales bacterium GAS188]|jgi:PAS domain S-box-containing protein|nr:PAS domain S-box-containing protein [Rhizobiales bacterium GAS188]
MSPPDRGQSRPDNVTDAWPHHPLAQDLSAQNLSAQGRSAEGAVLGTNQGTNGSTIEALLAKGAAAAVWALADGRALWWNELGAAVFGLPRAEANPAEASPADIDAALDRASRTERPWLERRRISHGRRPSGATLLFSRARLADGGEALVAVATVLAPPIVPDGRAVPPARPVSAAAEAADSDASHLASPPGAADGGKHQGETAIAVSSRRLTWQTDETGRLLAGPGASLSQALGRGAPMQPAMLGELFAENGAAVAEAIAAGQPIAGLPVVTLAAPDGTSFIGALFGAPVLDHGRRAAGYRGFMAVASAGRTQAGWADPPLANGAMTEPEASKAAFDDGGTADPVGAEFPADEGADEAEAGVATPAFSEISEAAQSGALGHRAASLGSASQISSELASRELASGEMAPLLQAMAPFRTAAGHGETVIALPKLIEPPIEPQARASNVITLRPPGAEPSRLKDAEGPPLSPAERDAFADIAKALGAAWTQPPSSGNGFDAGAPTNAEPQSEAAGDAQGLADVAAADLITIISRLPVGILVHRDGAAVAANKTLLDLLGYANLAEFDAHGGIEKLFADHADRGTDHAVAIKTRDGEVIEVDARCQAIKWRGESATLMTLRRSLASETKGLEASHQLALAAKQTRIDDLQAILDGTSDGVVTVDELGRILAMNPSAEKLFGYGAGEIAGEALAVLIAPECHHAIGAALAVARSPSRQAALPEPVEITGRERQGRRLPLSMKLFLSHASRPSPRLNVVFRDLSAVKSSEAGLVEARVTAERTTAQKSEFLAKVSHEIRTPLNSIVGFADIIAEERFGPLQNERYKEYVRDIRSSGTHIISLVNDLLDLSKIEAGRMELSFSNVSLNAEVGASAALVQMEAARSRVLMRQSLAQGLPAIIADARSVKQIVLNILSNAVKFTEPGGQVIVSTALSDKGEVIFRVRDTGIGMSERELAEAMEPFKQFATTLRPGGSGLGLSLTKALVKANQANLSISSTSNEGTLVEVVFPRERVIAA